MLHHVETYVTDLERSIAFWTPLMERLAAGYTLFYEAAYPYTGGPGHDAMDREDPDRIKVEVVAPRDA